MGQIQKPATEIVTTKDGSTTLFSRQFGQHYHNPNGAVAESLHVFFRESGLIEALSDRNTKQIHIFETGFGSGLNLAILNSLHQTCKSTANVHFFSVEAYPISPDQAYKIEFGNHHELESSRNILKAVFEQITPGVNPFQLSEKLAFTLYYGQFHHLIEKQYVKQKFDFFFHDPFSPDVNAELWTPETFNYLAAIAKPESILATYCAASSARAAMAVAGWKLCRKRGALGKREMTIASPSEKNLHGCKRLNEQRLAERYRRNEFQANE